MNGYSQRASNEHASHEVSVTDEAIVLQSDLISYDLILGAMSVIRGVHVFQRDLLFTVCKLLDFEIQHREFRFTLELVHESIFVPSRD